MTPVANDLAIDVTQNNNEPTNLHLYSISLLVSIKVQIYTSIVTLLTNHRTLNILDRILIREPCRLRTITCSLTLNLAEIRHVPLPKYLRAPLNLRLFLLLFLNDQIIFQNS